MDNQPVNRPPTRQAALRAREAIRDFTERQAAANAGRAAEATDANKPKFDDFGLIESESDDSDYDPDQVEEDEDDIDISDEEEDDDEDDDDDEEEDEDY